MKNPNSSFVHYAIILGIADFFEKLEVPFPYGGVDIFQIAHHKASSVYPINIQHFVWLLIVKTDFLRQADVSKWQLRVCDESGDELGKIQFQPDDISTTNEAGDEQKFGIKHAVPIDSSFTIIDFRMDGVLRKPGKYNVLSEYNGEVTQIGTLNFHYQRADPLTPDKISALESDPNSLKQVHIDITCNRCISKFSAYTGLTRSRKLEKEGYVWQGELPGEFKCKCGKNTFDLKFLKESMHSLLLTEFGKNLSGLSYIRRYGHAQVKKVAEQFSKLLEKETLEQPVQTFIEENPVLLCRFHAKRLFYKQNILGRFITDFAVIDSRNQLWLIELERPSMQLFKNNGHPTQALMHAYGQVSDWLFQFRKHQEAILEGMNLNKQDVVSVRGAVIAGRSKHITHETLQRHLANPPYPNIEFMTIDDLRTSLIEISRKVA